jgi:hypothetical protein
VTARRIHVHHHRLERFDRQNCTGVDNARDGNVGVRLGQPFVQQRLDDEYVTRAIYSVLSDGGKDGRRDAADLIRAQDGR